MDSQQSPMVVQYLYVHSEGEAFYYPTARSNSSVSRLANRYLECALTQAASLRVVDVDCSLVLATNLGDRRMLGRRGGRLIGELESLGVDIVSAQYAHRPEDDHAHYLSSRYVLDAIAAVSERQPPERQLWLTDLDCVWVDAKKVFASSPPTPEIGCLFVSYGPDEAGGSGAHGSTPRGISELAATMGVAGGIPPWIGGELLSGTSSTLRSLVEVCTTLDARLAEEGKRLPTEEQILTLAGALGLARFHDLSGVAGRIPTGPRHDSPAVDDPSSLGLWHLPAEKGLSLRRTAREITRGRMTRLHTDFSTPGRLERRFNVDGTGLARRLRDDGWLATQRICDALRSFSIRKRAT